MTIGAASAAASTHAVRVPADAPLHQAGIHATHNLDYGTFRWIVLDDANMQRLNQSGLAFTKVHDAGTLQVQDYRFDPVEDGEPDMPQRMRSDGDRAGLYFIQLVAPVTDDWWSEITAAGVRILQYYPHNAYLVWTDPAALAHIDALSFVRWQGAMHPAYKINAGVRDRGGVIRNVDVMFYNDGRISTTLDEFAKYGAEVLDWAPSQPDRAFYNAYLAIDADQIENLARMNTVLWIGYQSPEPILEDEMSDQIIADNHPGGVPVVGYNAHLASLEFDGTGVTWAIIDTGVDYSHPDLASRIVGGYQFPGACSGLGPGDDCANGGHGTHVAGIVGGDATAGYTDSDGFLYGLGVAPGYSIFAMNSLSGPSWPPAGGWQEHSKRAVLGNAIGGNNSWTSGEGTQHGYQATERTHDLMVRDGNFDTAGIAEPFIEVFSAGNSGFSGLTSPKEGKNLIVTAGTQNYRVSQNIDAMYGSSSRGPAVDGRWVPTIAAPAQEIASARRLGSASQCTSSITGTNGHYSFCTGTSMAAPHTSGTITLATQWWRSFNGGADPSPAMAKALLVNSADDIGALDIPNIHEGWGRINLTTLIDPPALREYRDQIDLFTETGQQLVFAVGVPDPGQPLKVTLAWSDAPGAVGANPALVNDLNLTVATGGDTYLGNVFSAGWSETGGSADTINNLENVYVENPAGTAIITIDAVNIAGDGVPYNGDTSDQDLVLVCTNCVAQPDFSLDVAPSSASVCAPDSGVFEVEIASILGYDDPVTLSALGVPAGASATFDVNPVIPAGTSTLTIGQTGNATPGSYPLEVQGSSSTGDKSRFVGLHLFNAGPSQPILSVPANGATNQSETPTFQWDPASQAGVYQLQISTDAVFTQIVHDATGIADTSYELETPLETSTQYYWRVRASNSCGTGEWSQTWYFATEAQPGDCGLGTQPVTHFTDDFESFDPGWTHYAATGDDTWRRDEGITSAHSGEWVYHVDDVETWSDQRLVSPSVQLPPDGFPISLKFWNYQHLEDKSSGCWDGAIVEISTDDGANWTHLPSAVMLTDPYDGPVTGLNELEGWCGDPQDWLESVVNLDDYAGEAVRFRFRIGTDSSLGRPGWDIDDVVVQSCREDSGEALPFLDGFETGDTTSWTETLP
jgi:subtilisin family serine protease